MKYAKIDSEYYCGIDLHARSMYVTVMDKSGKIYLRRNMKNNFDFFLKDILTFLPDLAVGVESTYNWYWLADGCHKNNIPFYLGHALYMKAISGSKKKNDKLDSQTLAELMRCNFFPPAYAYPREMRPTRDLLRRRSYFVSLRSGANTHIQESFAQEAILDVNGWDVKNKKTRHSLIERMQEPIQQLTISCDLDLMAALDPIINTLEKKIRAQAKHHDAKAVSILQTTPGIGDILSLTVLYEMHTIDRFPSVQDFSSYCRVVRCERTSNGKSTGGGNAKIGNPYLKWAFNQIIIRAQSQSPLIKRYDDRLIRKHGFRKARGIMGHKFAVAIYYMLKNGQAFDESRFLSSMYKL
jgi:transposase